MAVDDTKVREDHPDRCQGITRAGQCTNLSLEESEFCGSCGGNRAVSIAKQASLNNYRLGKWQAKMERHSRSDAVKNLREEIGILRMMLEERFNSIQDNSDLMLQSHVISDLVLKIERVVSSCHKLEGSMGQLLDKAKILHFGGKVIEILGQELNGQEDVMDRIADKILQEASDI